MSIPGSRVPRFSGPFVTATLALAVVCAMLVVRTARGREPLRVALGATEGPHALSQAMAGRLPTVGRLTGGFVGRTQASVTRSVSSRPLPEVRVLQILSSVTAVEDPSVRHTAAVARLLVGQIDESIHEFESVLRTSRPAAVLNDAAVAYLERGTATGSAIDLLHAANLGAEAVGAEPRLDEARFNLALCLEALHLENAAAKVWDSVVQTEKAEVWRTEALGRRATLSLDSVAEMNADRRARFAEELSRWSSTRLAEMLRHDSRPITDLFETELAWSQRRAAPVVAQLLTEITGDPISEHALEVSRGLDTHERAALNRVLEQFAHARDLLAANQLLAGMRAIEALESSLERWKHPYRYWARYYIAQSAFFTGATAQAKQALVALARDARRAGYTSVAARALYVIGLAQLREGDNSSVVTTQGEVRTLAETLRDRPLEASAASEVADAYERIAFPAIAWHQRLRAIATAMRSSDPRVRHVVLVGSARGAVKSRQLLAAMYFLEEAELNARRWGSLPALAESLIRRSEIELNRGAADQASNSLRLAEDALNQMPDQVFASGWRPDLELMKALTIRAQDLDPTAALEKAEQATSRRGSVLRMPLLHQMRAEVSLAHSVSEARLEVRRGLNVLARDAQLHRLDPLGRSRAEQRTALMSVLVESFLVEGDATGALDALLSLHQAERLDIANPSPIVDLNVLRRSVERGAVVVAFLSSETALRLWIVSSDDVAFISQRIGRTDLSQRIDRLSAALLARDDRGTRAVLGELHQILVAPVLARISHPTHIDILPDDLTSKVPFAALWDGTANRYLVEQTSLAFIPVLSARARPSRTVERRSLLSIGDPEAAGPLQDLPRLSGARLEAQEIARLYDRAEVLTGGDAVRSAIERRLPFATVFHFAGHATLHDDDPGLARLVLAGQGGRDDLTAGDIARMRHVAPIVVLAACQTADGPAVTSRGVFSLATSFLTAGSEAVIAGLWKVDDAATRHVASKVHDGLSKGLDASVALRRAQLAMLHGPESSWQHPYYWAALNSYRQSFR